MLRSETVGFDVATATIRRERLLARIALARPKILALIAPAGFGKTSLVKQVLGDVGRTGICDCSRVLDEVEFARRVVPALADEDPDRAATLTQTELLLAEGTLSAQERIGLALSAWRVSARPSAFVFENAEHLTTPGARDLLAMLLNECPEDRAIVVCSRQPLPLHLSRFAPPHRILTLRAPDLAIDGDELRVALHGSAIAAADLDRVHAISQGWPIALFLLLRFAQEGNLERLVTSLNDVAFEDLYDYLTEQVLGALDADIGEALFAATCIPHATSGDIAHATANRCDAERFHEFAVSSPFVTVTETGTYVVHPLLASTLSHVRSRSRVRVICETAASLETTGQHLRAAELYLALPDVEEAARALEQVAVAEDHAPSMRYAHVLASLDRALVKRFPTLWATSAVLQMFCVESELLYRENQEVWERCGPDTPLKKRYYVLITRVLLLTYLGRFDEARAVVDSVAPRASLVTPPQTVLDGYARYLHASVDARTGHLERARDDMEAALPLVRGMDILGSGALMILGADVARSLGARALERDLLDRAVATSLPSQLDNIIAQRDAEVLFGAWLWNEEAAYVANAERLARAVDERGNRGFAFFIERLQRRAWRDPDAGCLLKWAVCGYLVATGDAVDREEAETYARRALELAREHRAPLLVVLAAVAVAECTSESSTRTFALEDARRAAATVESPALQDAVRRIVEDDDDLGMLGVFVARRLRVARSSRTRGTLVEIVGGVLRRDDESIALTEREYQLIVALVHRNGLSRRALTETLWPESDEQSATNRLHATLHRMRERFGADDLVSVDGSGYRLAAGVTVDLWEMEKVVRALRLRSTVPRSERRGLRTLLERICTASPRLDGASDALAAVTRRVDGLVYELGTKLGRCALDDGDAVEALDIAELLIAHDACDEPAHEIAIRARLKLDDRAAALRQYRHYCKSLADELACEPSPSLAALVAASRA
ncbi:MAG: hypothetical protein NVS3B17_09910 [Vulcanimicrobiaceae bacterium]